MFKIEDVISDNTLFRNVIYNFENERYKNAISDLIIALEDEKNNRKRSDYILAIIVRIGECYEELEDYDNALNYFLQAKEISEHINDPDKCQIYGELGLLHEQLNSFELAESYNKKALEDSSDMEFRIAVYLNLANVLSKLEKKEDSIQTLRQAIIEVNNSDDDNLKYITHERLAEFEREYKNYDNAIVSYRNAMPYCDERQCAILYSYIAYIYEEQNHRNTAIENYKKALLIFREYDDHISIISSLLSLGHLYFNNRNFKKAIDAYEQALKIIDDNNDNDLVSKADILYNMGEVYLSICKYSEAETLFLKGIQIAETINEKQVLLSSYSNISLVYAQWGNTDKSIEFSNKGLQLSEMENDKDSIAANYNNLAMLFVKNGDFVKALKYQESALSNADRNNPYDYSRQIHNKGFIYHTWADYETAIYHYRQALQIAEKHSVKENVAIFKGSIGSALFDMKHHKQALELYKEIFEYRKKEGDIDLIISSLIQLATCYDILNNPETAMKYLTEAEKLAERKDYNISLPTVYNHIGNVYFSQKNYKLAHEYYNKALELDIKYQYKKQQIVDIQNIGGCLYYMKDYKGAIENYNKSISLIEDIRTQAPLMQKRTFLEDGIRSYNLLLSSYVEISEYEKAILIAEKSKARTLSENINDLFLEEFNINTIIDSISSDTIILYYTIIENTEIIVISISKNEQIATRIPIKSIVDKIYNEFRVEKFIEKQTQKLKRSSSKKTTKRSYQKVESELQIIIDYYLDRLRGNPEVFWEIDIKRQGTLQLSSYIYQLLIGYVEHIISPYKNLIVVPDKELYLLPFESLYDGKHFLVENYNVTYVQSLNVYAALKKRDYKHPPFSVLGFGGAIYDNKNSLSKPMLSHEDELINLRQKVIQSIKKDENLTEFYSTLGLDNWALLPYSLKEVEEIKKMIPNAEIYTGEKASLDTIIKLNTKNKLSQYRTLHFATHGISFTTIPELSALILSVTDKDSETDRYLDSSKIVKLDMKVDFVNLSACGSGLGKIYAGEGIVGILLSFFEAGAKGIGATLWEIDDEGTFYIMKIFYDLLLKGGTYSEALNNVKRECIKGNVSEDLMNPFYWASFVYYGDSSTKFIE